MAAWAVVALRVFAGRCLPEPHPQAAAACSCTHLLLLLPPPSPCRPYFLPCCVAGLLAAGATLASAFCLDETLPSRRAAGGAASSSARYQQVPSAADEPGSPPTPGEVELQPGWRKGGALASGGDYEGSSKAGRLRAFRGDSARMSAGADGRLVRARHAQPPPDSPRSSVEEEKGGAGADAEADDDFVVFGPADLEAAAAPAAQRAAAAPWYRQRLVLTALGGYGLIAFFYIFLDELIPIFASAAPADGGLGFSPSQLAPSLSFGGAVLVAWALKGFPWLMR